MYNNAKNNKNVKYEEKRLKKINIIKSYKKKKIT